MESISAPPPDPATPAARLPSAFSGHAIKLVILVVGWLLLTVLLGMIGGLVGEREQYRHEAEQRVAAGWGGRQIVGAPLLRLRHAPRIDKEGQAQAVPDRWLALDQASLAATLQGETRRLGLFDVPVYTADLQLRGELAGPRLQAALGTAEQPVVGADLLLPLSDPRGLRSAVSLQVNGTPLRLVPVTGDFNGQRLLGSELPLALLQRGELKLSGQFVLAGIESLQALPTASELAFSIAGDWPDPGFASGLLPRERRVEGSGFDAQWQVFDFNTGMPPSFVDWQVDRLQLGSSLIGVSLQQPGEVYQRNERAWKYGTLFVALTLAAWFLIELLLRRNLWALDYALIGVSQVCFYLLLLALSEHIGFDWAYAVASAVFASMVGAFSVGLLGSRRRGVVAAAVLGSGYGALYLLIGSESHALLLGAILVTALIGAAMWIASRLRRGSGGQTAAAALG
ncbi:MAG: inner membrane CreD family protein [Xanthomonadales bacterium]|nr:inner membrane CreD family protein [Xanthomonadales bacterium]